jgi:SpoVK/Ycf46/Vps4 family AAA+-type ATPase
MLGLFLNEVWPFQGAPNRSDGLLGFGQLILGDSLPEQVYESDDELRDVRVPLTPEDDWARLCPPRVLGYSLDQKAMVQFKVSSAFEITEKKMRGPFDNELQLKDAQKEMLLALVDEHDSGENPTGFEDIISDKGRSLVILLHGPPGVGKTLTAETVAKATGKPLLVVSVAEVGLKAAQAESKLERLFDLAAKWDAILLVDEADVFLESRSSDADPERNALVSVLLRVLEYYTGTIILTTNRISSLDMAVQSRIHLAIRYTELSDNDCLKIFEIFLARLEFEGRDKQEVHRWFKSDVAEAGLNGRQIRNLVSSAQAIAKSKDVPVNLDCFKGVFKVTQAFQKQLAEQAARWKAANEVDFMRKR